MKEEWRHWRLGIHYLGINLAGFCFAAAALFLSGPIAAIGTFMVTITALLAAFYIREKQELQD